MGKNLQLEGRTRKIRGESQRRELRQSSGQVYFTSLSSPKLPSSKIPSEMGGGGWEAQLILEIPRDETIRASTPLPPERGTLRAPAGGSDAGPK